MKITTKQLKHMIKEEFKFLSESFGMEEKIRGLLLSAGVSAAQTAANIRSAAYLLTGIEMKEDTIEQILKDAEGKGMFTINSVKPLEEYSLSAGIRLMKEYNQLRVFYFRIERNYSLVRKSRELEPIVNKLSGKFSYSLEGLEEALYSIADYFDSEYEV
tara:strand:+ start:299 stop:775 length:477 start_codon:yes stop_codon:yes gene_type:complete